MGVEYKLVSTKTKEKFDLGRGTWWDVFSKCTKLNILEIAESKDDFRVMVEWVLEKKEYTPEESNIVADKIWDWCQSKEFYFGDDCTDVYDENKQEIYHYDCRETGSVYG